MKMQNPLKRLQSRGLLGNCKNFIVVLAGFIFLPLLNLEAQTVIGGSTPDPSAMLDVQSQTKGVLFPRMTTAERNLITNAPTGLMIFNTSENRLQINLGTPGNASWQNINPKGSIFNLDCASAVLTGSLFSGQAASGVSVSIAYTDGDGQSHGGQTVNSTGVTGLTATLSAGSFATGAGNLIYNISGTPSATGTASFALTIGGQNCTLTLTVQQLGSITGLICNDAIRKGEMQPGITYNSPSWVTVIVPYMGGNGGVHSGQTVMSTGSTGFTATLSAGNFASGSGNLTYEITGSGATGTATFALNIGGSSCDLDLEVKSCSAMIDASTTKTFLCYNLGAYNTRASSSAPSWEINGGYWQWGAKPEAAAGPTGSGAAKANSGAIDNWTSLPVGGNGAWLNASKTADDPCPAGFRVPTETQWNGVRVNNSQSNVGSSWSSSATNYTTGKNFGSALFLPAAGYRDSSTGTLFNRGNRGYYWSSTEHGTGSAWTLRFLSGGAVVVIDLRTYGFSLRCISE